MATTANPHLSQTQNSLGSDSCLLRQFVQSNCSRELRRLALRRSIRLVLAGSSPVSAVGDERSRVNWLRHLRRAWQCDELRRQPPRRNAAVPPHRGGSNQSAARRAGNHDDPSPHGRPRGRSQVDLLDEQLVLTIVRKTSSEPPNNEVPVPFDVATPQELQHIFVIVIASCV